MSSNPNIYTLKLDGVDFSDCISLDGGYSTNSFLESPESETGITLDGVFRQPVLWRRNKINVKCIGALRVARWGELARALRFTVTGENAVNITWWDFITGGLVTRRMYCSSVNDGERMRLPDGDFVLGASFSLQDKDGIR